MARSWFRSAAEPWSLTPTIGRSTLSQRKSPSRFLLLLLVILVGCTPMSESETSPRHGVPPAAATSKAPGVGSEETLWLLIGKGRHGGAPVACVRGRTRCISHAGILPSAVTRGDGTVWVANASGRGISYGLTMKGPGYPLEDSIAAVSDHSHVNMFRIRDPAGLCWIRGALYALTRSTGTRPAVITRFDPETGEQLGHGQVPDGETLLVAGDAVAAYGLAPHASGARLWVVDSQTMRVTNSIRVEYGLAAASRKYVVTVRTGEKPRGTSIDVDSMKVRRLWIASQHRRAIREDGCDRPDPEAG